MILLGKLLKTLQMHFDPFFFYLSFRVNYITYF